MDYSSYLRAILALIFVVGLIGLVSFLIKKFVIDRQASGDKGKVKRLSVEEVRYVDAKRRLLLVKRDNVEHLILLGTNSDLLIEKNINKEI